MLSFIFLVFFYSNILCDLCDKYKVEECKKKKTRKEFKKLIIGWYRTHENIKKLYYSRWRADSSIEKD